MDEKKNLKDLEKLAMKSIAPLGVVENCHEYSENDRKYIAPLLDEINGSNTGEQFDLIKFIDKEKNIAEKIINNSGYGKGSGSFSLKAYEDNSIEAQQAIVAHKILQEIMWLEMGIKAKKMRDQFPFDENTLMNMYNIGVLKGYLRLLLNTKHFSSTVEMANCIREVMEKNHTETMQAHNYTHSKVEAVPVIVHENQTEEGKACLQTRGMFDAINATEEEITVYKAYYNDGINTLSQNEVAKITGLSKSKVRRRAINLNQKAGRDLIVWNNTLKRSMEYEADKEQHRIYEQKERE
jgi:hypothetical protein